MTAIANIPFAHIAAILAGIGGLVAFIWRAGFSIVDKVEKSKQKQIDYAHKKSEQLEVQKVELQKELETQKQRHVHKLIEAIREEMAKVLVKVDALSVQFGRVDEKLKHNVEMGRQNLDKIKCFIDTTSKRIQTVDRELATFRTEVKEIGKDMLLIKTVAAKVGK